VPSAPAAEIVLRPTANPSGTIVRLGDVAELRGGLDRSSENLAEVPLMPAPAPGTKRFLGVREVRDMLQASGVSVSSHRFTGSTQVTVEGEMPEALRRRVGSMTTAQLGQVEKDLCESIKRHLNSLAAMDEPWLITVRLEDEQLRQLAEAAVPWTIQGGSEPWLGPQSLTIAYETPGGKGTMTVEAEAALPAPVVILTRPMARGMTLSRADVALMRLSDAKSIQPHRTEDPHLKLEDVLGKVVRRPLREGQVLTGSMIEAPTLVKRGQNVVVVALAGGIRITTEARAKQSGTEGELIYVETLDSREPFAALVSGVREVQVIGR
jgi:flagella basal body P-ring formation protein FlgA